MPTVPDPPATAPAAPGRRRVGDRDWTRVAVRLVTATLAYNVIEAVVAIRFGVEAESIALFGFGLDSVIEVSAAAALLWRFRMEARGASRSEVEAAEHRVHRFIGGTFLALAAYVVVEAGGTLWRRAAPEPSQAGILLASASLIVMPLVAWGKLRAARELDSAALRAEAMETLVCSYLSFALLAGLGANALWGAWWADPVAALAMVPWIVKEGLEGWRGGCACG